MDGKVIKPFFDLSNPSDVYAVGDTFEGTDERVNGLIQKGFLEPIAEKPKPKRTTRKKSTTKE